MKLQHHTVISLGISALLFAALRSWQLAASSFLTGVFIDLDHFIDVFAEYRTHFTIREFFDICENGRFRRVRLVLHSWELLPILGIAAFATDWNPWVLGATIGAAQHVLCDQLYNNPTPLTYFLIWRWRHGFDRDEMFMEKE